MTHEEREAFLAEPYIGVVSVTAEPEREEAGRFALCAQLAEVEDYRYVSVEGPVTEIRPASERERYDMAARYMEPDQATAYVNATEETESGNIAIHMRPERWNSFDFRRTRNS
jgi:hypothetical protein